MMLGAETGPAVLEAVRWVLFPFGFTWTLFWPARHALLAVALLLFYVHGFAEPESEDPYLF
jgi:hypothetical protein